MASTLGAPVTADQSAAAAILVEKAAAQLVDLMVAGSQGSSNSGSEGQNNGTGSISKIGLNPAMLTPLQRLVLEEVGKILGAGARRTFTTVKERSGRLPTGRTLLGTVIDPLGLFQRSNLIETDDADERTLEAAGKLLEILQTANGDSNMASNANVLQDITPVDARKLATSVSRRLWEKRAELTVLTGHLAYVILRQTARRLEKPKSIKSKVLSTAVDSGILSSTTSPVSALTSSEPESDSGIASRVVSASDFSDRFARPSPSPLGGISATVRMSESDRLLRARLILSSTKQNGIETS